MDTKEFREVVTLVASETGSPRNGVSITYREDPEGDEGGAAPWIVGIACRFARSRAGNHYTNEGYGSTPRQAATDAIASLQRAVADGRIKRMKDD